MDLTKSVIEYYDPWFKCLIVSILSIFIRCNPNHFLEPTAEMLRIWKSQFVGYLADGFGDIEYTLFRYIEHLLLDMFQRRNTGFLFQKVA